MSRRELPKGRLTNPDNFLKMPDGGFKRWRPHQFFDGWNPDGTMKKVQGFKNTLTDQEFIPPKGWDADLSRLEHGDLATIRHSRASDEFWESIKDAQPLGEVVKQEDGHTILRY